MIRKAKETMTARERVLAAFHHQAVDRVPVNYAANAGIDRRLKAALGVMEHDDEGLRQALGVDFRGVGPIFRGPQRFPERPGRTVDPALGIYTRWIKHESGGYWDFCDFPLKDATLEEIEAWPLAVPDDYDYSTLREQCQRHAPHAIYYGGANLPDIINSTSMLRGMEEVLVDLITENPAGLRLIDRKLDLQLEVLQRTLEQVGQELDIIWMGEDLGTQIAPIISLDLFRQQIRPRHQRVIDLAKAYDLPVMVHTCGSSSWAYDDFIDMGVTAVDTLQPEATNMAPAYLKARFGNRLAFHGCISTAGPVATGTPNDVTRNVRETLDIMTPGGGYLFAPTHCLQDNSPVENVLAMYQAAHDY